MSKLTSVVQKLSKSSPHAVFTPKLSSDTESKDIFDYLYIETKIEKHYKELLEENKTKKIVIFLCGSSGDGKSAIIGRNINCFDEYYDVHIDATHSFKPDQTAIEALDERFLSFKNSEKSLIVGVNIGILLNFAKEGSDEHKDIREAIQVYDKKGTSSQSIMFINFEEYSKFEMTEDAVSSPFIQKLLDNVTQSSIVNPFYEALQNDRQLGIFNSTHQNFQLLSLEPVKKSIVELLVTVHLKYDQFLTVRSLLDFVYTLLAGGGSLIHQLFMDESNAIIENIRKEDPCILRTEKLDTFVLERKSKKTDEELNAFIDEFNEMFDFPLLTLDDPHLLIRTFYLFRNDACATNYHEQFSGEFNDHTTYDFVKLLYAHEQFAISSDESLIQEFYTSIEKAILAYANKQLPHLSSEDLITLSEINDYALCTTIEFDPDWKAIETHTKHMLHSFPCFLKVNNVPIGVVSISLGMYKLIHAINAGYRPNKHDRNTIVIFEELIGRIIDHAKGSRKLVVVKGDAIHEFKNNEGKIKVKTYVR